MADTQLGGILGLATPGVRVGTAVPDGDTLLAEVTADGINNVVVDDISQLEIGMVVDIVTRADGTIIASARTVTAIDSATNTVTYDGADVAATAAEGLYLTGSYTPARSNINGGKSISAGFDMDQADTVTSMREALQTFDASTYSNDQLNKMTYNDLVYACRVVFRPLSIRSEPLPTL